MVVEAVAAVGGFGGGVVGLEGDSGGAPALGGEEVCREAEGNPLRILGRSGMIYIYIYIYYVLLAS